jgi:hypothetical protein
MLQQFSWQQFLIAATVLTLIWYAGVILLCYGGELKGFLSGGDFRPGGWDNAAVSGSPAPLPHRWEKGVEEIPPEEELLGRSKVPDGVDTVGTADFGFCKSDGGREQQLGLVPDVLAEIREVFRILGREDGTKKDFLALMTMLKEKYPKIGANPNVGSINAFIRGQAPFHISPQELDDLWV